MRVSFTGIAQGYSILASLWSKVPKLNSMQVISTSLEKDILERTSSTLKAIAHPVRLSIIDLLREGNRMNVTQIYTALGLEQAVASQHLSILKEKEILDSSRKGKHSYYFLKHPRVIEVINLILGTYQS